MIKYLFLLVLIENVYAKIHFIKCNKTLKSNYIVQVIIQDLNKNIIKIIKKVSVQYETDLPFVYKCVYSFEIGKKIKYGKLIVLLIDLTSK